jgi:hypothetical protein
MSVTMMPKLHHCSFPLEKIQESQSPKLLSSKNISTIAAKRVNRHG